MRSTKLFCLLQRRALLLGLTQRLLQQRFALVELSLSILEEQCAEKTQQVLARERMTDVQIALMEFSCRTPESESLQEVKINFANTINHIFKCSHNA